MHRKRAVQERRKRGRPPKFGRPARTVAVTLPEDVIETLRAADPDVGRAIVRLVATAATRGDTEGLPVHAQRTAGLQSVIFVDPNVLPPLPRCSLMRIGQDRAFIALEPGAGLADLEVVVIDELSKPQAESQRRGLQVLRTALRKWRTDPRVTVHERAIVVLEGDDV